MLIGLAMHSASRSRACRHNRWDQDRAGVAGILPTVSSPYASMAKVAADELTWSAIEVIE
jgi:hypothetical protein